MRKLIFLAMFAFAMLAVTDSVFAQSGGQWVPCLDPGGSGHTVSCLITNSTTVQTNVAVSQTQVQQQAQQVVIIVQQPAVAETPRRNRSRRDRNRNYDPDDVYVPVSRNPEISDVPYYETQDQTITETSYGGGIDRWSRSPYGHYEVRTRRIRVRAEANSLTYRPTFQISTTYWPTYYYR